MFHRSIVHLAVSVLATAALCVPAAPAAASTQVASFGAPVGTVLSGSAGYAKPQVVTHPDRAPSVPGASGGLLAPTGAAPAAPVVPIADRSGAGSEHVAAGSADVWMSGTILTGSGSGTNKISFANFDDGDIVVVEDPVSFTGHAGIFDKRYYSSLYSYAVLSANTQPANGVQREQCLKFRAYDQAWGLWVPSENNHGVAARNFAYREMGKPYSVLASKTDLRSFYCSKLAWVAWRYTSGLDLDADRGFWVWPIDLVNSPYTRVFGYWG